MLLGMGWKYILFACFLGATPLGAQEAVTVSAPQVIVDTGLMKYLMPRFSLKTGIRLALVPEAGAVVVGTQGTPIMQGLGAVWSVRHNDSPEAARFADWMSSEVGQRTIESYAPEGDALFAPAPVGAQKTSVSDFAGDPLLGLEISVLHCSRCHAVVPGKRYNSIGSTPSFFVLRTLRDWPERFSAFYALNPHPAFTQIADVTAPFPENRPSPIAPIEMTRTEIEAVLAYVAGLEAADLGNALAHQ